MTKTANQGPSHSGGCPVHQVTESDITYNDYLKISELISLQVPLSKPAHHDELLFITIHQAYELWFKLVLHEMEAVVTHMQEGNILQAHHFMSRVGQILKLLVGQIHLLETMRPVDFLQFRENLRPASGFQSLQFREIEFLSGLQDSRYLESFKKRPDLVEKLKARMSKPNVRGVFYEMISKLGYPVPRGAGSLEDHATPGDPILETIVEGLVPIYSDPSKNLPLYLLAESLVEFDQQMSLWREHHVRVVERVIGNKPGTGGSEGVPYLQSTTCKRSFPLLWAVRSALEIKT